MQLVCHLMDSEYERLARQIWSALRKKVMMPFGTDADGHEIRTFNESPLESIIDIPNRCRKREPPTHPYESSTREFWDGAFGSLQAVGHRFGNFLIRKILKYGQLVLSRPLHRESTPDQYLGGFDTAELSDFFMSLRNNSGNEAPRGEHSWFPMNWRLQQENGSLRRSGEALFCQGLVAGNWKAEYDCMEDVYLL